MSKVSLAEADNLICRVEGLEIRAMDRKGRYPAKEWADGLDKKGQGQLLAAARIIAISFQMHRPPAGRFSKVATSETGLWELRVTPAGASAPHLRLLYLRQGTVLWAAHGFTKQKNQLTASDVRAGDSVARSWLEGRRR